ncbi:hypothetical protein ES703_41288 [subsurface metagenome]
MKINLIGGTKKANPIKANFKPDDGFSPQGVPRTAYYTRDCHGATAAHYANLDCRQTSFEPGTRCAFQIDSG